MPPPQQPISSMMQGLSLGDRHHDPSSPTPQSRSGPSHFNPHNAQSQQQGSSQNRVPSVLKRYMNPGLTRPPNTGLAALSSAQAESIRGPLFKIAGVNNPPSSSTTTTSTSAAPSQSRTNGQQFVTNNHKDNHASSPRTKLSLTKHTAHGLHGPAHSTTSRALSSALNPHATGHPSASAATTTSSSAAGSKGGIGKYDGGLEADDVGKEVVNSEAAKVLELDGWVLVSAAFLLDGWWLESNIDSRSHAAAHHTSLSHHSRSGVLWVKVNSAEYT